MRRPREQTQALLKIFKKYFRSALFFSNKPLLDIEIGSLYVRTHTQKEIIIVWKFQWERRDVQIQDYQGSESPPVYL